MQVQTNTLNHFTAHDISAITKIQASWRGYRVRRNFLSNNVYNQAKAFIDKCEDITKIPKASTGVTKVYFPQEIPVALKALGIPRNRRRFLTMWLARDVCAKSDYKNLVIPKAYPYKEFNIEEKLPVIDVKQKEQVALYEDNKHLFTQVVKEVTGFLCQTVFPDILTYTHPYQTKYNIPLCRYDNIPLLLDGLNGKIALIDLGGLKKRTDKLSIAYALETAQTALYIFPYHFQEIYAVVINFCSDLNKYEPELKTLSEHVLNQFQSIYKNHIEFLKEKILAPKPHPMTEFKLMELNTAGLKDEFLKEFFYYFYQTLDIIRQAPLPKEPTASDLCERTLTINCSDIPFFDDKVMIEEKKAFIQRVLDQLILHKEIGFANFYYNRARQINIRIHY